jgi:hypothetical protein
LFDFEGVELNKIALHGIRDGEGLLALNSRLLSTYK